MLYLISTRVASHNANALCAAITPVGHGRGHRYSIVYVARRVHTYKRASASFVTSIAQDDIIIYMEMKTGIIYGLVDNSTMELRYVGQTRKPLHVRFKRHMKLLSPNVHFNNWLRIADVSAIVLERDPINLNEAEMCWIADMRAAGARLLNMTDGGGGCQNYKHTLEICAKISAAMMGKQNGLGYKHTAEVRAKISVASRSRSIETRAKLSAASMGNHNALGHKHTPETRAKISVAARSHA